MANYLDITWRDVLDPHKRILMSLDKVVPVAVELGYQYFAWNGWVCRVIDNASFEWTQVQVEDL